jgi:hypothetical protein
MAIRNKSLSCLLLSWCLWGSVTAQNPIIQTHFSPDPAPMVYNGKVYVYTGDDIPGFDFYYMTKWRVSSSADMVNWTDHEFLFHWNRFHGREIVHGPHNVLSAMGNFTGTSVPKQLITTWPSAWQWQIVRQGHLKMPWVNHS